MHPGEEIPQPTTYAKRVKLARRLQREERVPFTIIVDEIDDTVRKLYRAWPSSIFIINRDGLLVYKSLWAYGPAIELTLKELSAWETARAKHILVRICYSEKLVGLVRNSKISATVHRRAGADAVKNFTEFLENEGIKG